MNDTSNIEMIPRAVVAVVVAVAVAVGRLI
jgi:hypothetical protein